MLYLGLRIARYGYSKKNLAKYVIGFTLGNVLVLYPLFFVVFGILSEYKDGADQSVKSAGSVTLDKRSPSPDLVLIAGGPFQMGDSFAEGATDEGPVHTVELSSFFMSRHEVTNGQYRDFLQSALTQGLITVIDGVVYRAGSEISYPYCDTSTSSSSSQIAYNGGVFRARTRGGRYRVNDPAVYVSWYGAAAYCNWLSQQESRKPCYDLETWECDFSKDGYHLPTEAQWEYAARGGLSGKRFPWGDTISHSQVNYLSDSRYRYDTSPTRGYHPTWSDGVTPYTSPVGSFAPNGYDLYDMAGNVWEWCNDWHSSSYYSSSPHTNSTGPTSGISHVIRGGGWSNNADDCRVANRVNLGPVYRNFNLGFRISVSD